MKKSKSSRLIIVRSRAKGMSKSGGVHSAAMPEETGFKKRWPKTGGHS